MNLVLKKKQGSDNATWVDVWENIEAHVSREEVQQQTHQTQKEMQAVLSAFDNPIYGWSGGKDSLVLYELIMTLTPNAQGAHAHYGLYEFPEQVEWFKSNTPAQVTKYINPKWTLEWLVENEDRYLFPNVSKDWHYYAIHGTHWAQKQLYDEVNADLLLLGRRYADGNYISDKEGPGMHFGKDMMTYNPIRDWSHEVLLAFIHYNRIAIPPCYAMPDGWSTGTTIWPAVGHTPTQIDGWKKLWKTHPNIVKSYASMFKSGREFLNGLA